MNEDDEEQVGAFLAMQINNAIIEYIDECEELGVTISVDDGETMFLNAQMVTEIATETHAVAIGTGNEDFAKGATLVTQCIIDLARTLYSRNSEVTVEDLFGSEDNE